jgi:hypothetical protein
MLVVNFEHDEAVAVLGIQPMSNVSSAFQFPQT